MMREVLLTLLLVSAEGSLLGIAALGLRRLFRKRTHSALWYYLWIAVILRFLLPVQAPVAVPLPVPTPAIFAAEQLEGGRTAGEMVWPQTPSRPLDAAESPPDSTSAAARTTLSPVAMLLGLWALVAAGRFSHDVWKASWFAKLARSGGTDAAAIPELWGLVEETAEQLGLPHPPAVYVHEGIDIPLQLGLRRPAVLLPRHILGLGRQAMRHILIHEFVHCKRCDTLYKWLIHLLVCVHWFNPMVYWFQRRISVDCELSCDARVLRVLCAEEHRPYGEMLLSVAARLSHSSLPAGSVMLSENAKTLKYRLAQISGYGSRARPLAALSGCLAVLLLTCGFIAGPSIEQGPQPVPAAGLTAVNDAPVDASQTTPKLVVDNIEDVLGDDDQPTPTPQARIKPRPVISVAGKIDFSVIREHFFGVWTMIDRPDFQVRIGYGYENFCDGHTRVTAAYFDESGNAVIEVLRGGALDRHVVFAGEPDTMYTLTGSLISSGYLAEYTRTGTATEPPSEIFGYFDMLDYCLGGDPGLDLLSETDTPFHTFYYTLVALDDGTGWERSANFETPYPTLYLVNAGEDSITLRSLFYPQGTEPSEESLSTAQEIIFTVSKGGDGWQIRSAALV